MKTRIILSVAFAIAMVTSMKGKNVYTPLVWNPFPTESNEWGCKPPEIDPTELSNESDATNVAAQFPGGKAALNKYFSKSLKYPLSAYNFNIQGTVVCRFTINEEGYVTNARVVQSLLEECDKEALRVIYEMPRWRVAKHNGEPTSYTYEVPITFKIDENVR